MAYPLRVEGGTALAVPDEGAGPRRSSHIATSSVSLRLTASPQGEAFLGVEGGDSGEFLCDRDKKRWV